MEVPRMYHCTLYPPPRAENFLQCNFGKEKTDVFSHASMWHKEEEYDIRRGYREPERFLQPPAWNWPALLYTFVSELMVVTLPTPVVHVKLSPANV